MLIGKSGQVWVRGMYELRQESSGIWGRGAGRGNSWCKGWSRGGSAVAMRQGGYSKGWREMVAGGGVVEAAGPKGGKDLGLPPE